ncbi:MAG: outer membrane lipoprotein carrier protein LolA [Rhodobacteraceae bacterium]|nr:outer membrane lipoprotein carrier protein LolA [Paracoccaceae bacterium]
MLKSALTALVFVGLAFPAAAEKLSLRDLSAYLTQMKTAEATFTQINDDGSITTGTISIKRPGKARFEYNPPAAARVLVSAGSISVYDLKFDTPPERYPLKRTPLKLILARTVDLETANMVDGHSFDGTATTVRARDPKNPELGWIDLVFTADPIELRQWVVTDDAGTQTTLILGGLTTGLELPNDLFTIETVQTD